MKFLLLAFPLLALALSLSGLCNAQSAPFSSQSTTPITTTGDCTGKFVPSGLVFPFSLTTSSCLQRLVNVTIGRNYIRKINTITQVALESFGRNTTIFLPLTTPLTIGLTQRPIFTRTGPNMTALSSVVTANGQAMKQLAGTLETIAQDWASSESTYQATYGPQPNASERRQFIASINNITRTQLHQLGRNNSRLLRITDPLSATLLFSQFTSLGYTLFNANQNIDKTGGNLRGLADTLEDMARKWSMTTAQFLDQEAIFCQSSSSASVSRAVPEQQQFDQQCLASRPTNRSFITALNENTQKTLTAFGQSNLRLQSLSTALWLGLRFSTLTQRGFTAYNYNQNISVTGAELKAFAEAILEVTRQWEAAEVQFARDSNRDCRLPSPTTNTTTDPLINPRVMPNSGAPVTAAPAEVVTTSSLAPSPVTSAVSQASTTAAPVTPSAIVEASTSTASVAPEEAAATTTVSPAVSQTSTTAAVPVTSAIRETSTSTASPVSTTAAPSVIVEASTSAVVPSTASVAPEETATTAAAVTTVSSVFQTSTAAPVTSVIRETSTSTVNPETSSPVTSAVSQVSLASTTVAPSVIVEASTSAAVPSTASVAPEDAIAAAAVTTVSPVSQTSTSSAAPVTSVIVETLSSTVVPGTATAAEESSSVATEVATEVATQLSLDTTVSPLQENFIN